MARLSALSPVVCRRRGAYSSGVKPLLSLRSAPAQKQLSTALAITNALVGPLASDPGTSPAAPPARAISLPLESYCACTDSIWSRRELSSARERALREEGRFSSRMRMCPLFGAGRLVTTTRGCASVADEYGLGNTLENLGRGVRHALTSSVVDGNRGGILTCG